MFVKPVESLWWKLQWESKVLSILLTKLSKSRPYFLLGGESASIITTHPVQPPVFLQVARGDYSICQEADSSVLSFLLGSSLLQALLLRAGPTVQALTPLSPSGCSPYYCNQNARQPNNPRDTVCGHRRFVTFLIRHREKTQQLPTMTSDLVGLIDSR